MRIMNIIGKILPLMSLLIRYLVWDGMHIKMMDLMVLLILKKGEILESIVEWEKKQMQVSEFINRYVPLENRKKFNQLMKDWDGDDRVVLQAFYDMDVLIMKLKESNEGI